MVLLYDNYVKLFVYVPSTTFKFQIQDYESTFLGTDLMEIYVTGYSDFKRVKLLLPYKDYSITVSPVFTMSFSLNTDFTISITPVNASRVDTTGFLYSYAYYFNYTTMLIDKANYRTDGGFIIGLNRVSNSITTKLPIPTSNDSSLYMLIAILTPNGLTTLHQ